MNSTALWYLTRGTGAVTLVLLTLTVALGVLNVRRARTTRIPRFVVDAVHRNAALLAVAFLLVHVGTAVLDRFAPIRLMDVIVPFGARYRPVWLGFGAVAFDLLIAVALTSMIRRRLGYRAWRATHWAAYASWPIALIHGLGTGSDTKTTWLLGLSGVCVIVVIVAVTARATAGWPEHRGARLSALAASALVPLGLLVWLPAGPLAAGWAVRAGTPAALLHAGSSRSGPRLAGTLRELQLPNGMTRLDIAVRVSGERLTRLHIQIDGEPISGGGVQMSSSAVSLGTAADPTAYLGGVVALDGSNVHARVRSADGGHLGLIAQLAITPGSSAVSGTLVVRTIRGE